MNKLIVTKVVGACLFLMSGLFMGQAFASKYNLYIANNNSPSDLNYRVTAEEGVVIDGASSGKISVGDRKIIKWHRTNKKTADVKLSLTYADAPGLVDTTGWRLSGYRDTSGLDPALRSVHITPLYGNGNCGPHILEGSHLSGRAVDVEVPAYDPSCFRK